MIRMFARRRHQQQVAGGTDAVLFGMSLPADSVVHDIKWRIDAIDAAAPGSGLKIHEACMFGIEGWVLPILDPDAGVGYDTVWDTLVPKDTDTQVVDLDTGASDTTPFFEPGETDWTQVLDVGLRPQKVYGSYPLLTAARGALSIYQYSQSPFDLKWVPGMSVNVRIKRPLRIKQPSVLLFAIGSPAMDDTTNVAETVLAENEWPRVKYIGEVLHQAMIHLFGLTEAGAETPWEEATALLQRHLEPDILEATANTYVQRTWYTFSEGMVDHSVPGELGKSAISTGR